MKEEVMNEQEEAKTCKCQGEEQAHCGCEGNEAKKCKCDPQPAVSSEPKEILVEKNLDYKDKYLRMLAETENTRKRLQKEKHETIRFAIENTICEFLPALDNFETALKFSQSSSEEVKNWATGFQMILAQFRDVMHNHGVVAFHSEGNLFDPHFHEAMEIVEINQHPDGTILEEYAKGYKSQQRTIRPAKVKVAKKPLSAQSENESQSDENLKQNNQK
jgi:molecular chaperone GrpE